jgi:hypothetical protein
MPFKSRRIYKPQTTTPVRVFFTYPLLFICACVGTKKLARTGNRRPQNTHCAGNPACQSRSVHTVNKYRETYLNPLQNIFTGKCLVISKIVELVYAHSCGGRSWSNNRTEKLRKNGVKCKFANVNGVFRLSMQLFILLKRMQLGETYV